MIIFRRVLINFECYEENETAYIYYIYGVIFVHASIVHSSFISKAYRHTSRMTSRNEINDSSSKFLTKDKLLLLIVSISVLSVALVYQPLPDNFPQPWKYRVLSFWAHLFSKLVMRNCFYFFEKFMNCFFFARAISVNN